LLSWPSDQLTRRRSHHFPVIAASGFSVSGVAVLVVLAVGAGQVALNQIRTIPAPWRQRMLGEQRGDDSDRIFTDRRCDRGGRRGYEGLSDEESGRGVECTV
jgi:hypothetical protein